MKLCKILIGILFFALSFLWGAFMSNLISNIFLSILFSGIGGASIGILWGCVNCWIDFKQKLKKEDGTE